MQSNSTTHGTPDTATTPILHLSGPRAMITLNRPRQHNRIERADVAALKSMFDQIEGDDGVRVLVITGASPTFSSGYDIGSLAAGSGTSTAVGGDEFGSLCDRLEDLRVPTICALNGSVYGGATDFALACDLRIGAEGIRMVMPASRLGIHYYYGGLRRYVERTGLGAAKHLFLTGEPIDAQAMLRVGFLNEVVPLDRLKARVDELATVLANGAPLSVQGMKASLNDIARGTADASAVQARFGGSLRSTDVAEGLAAWTERRQPRFAGR